MTDPLRTREARVIATVLDRIAAAPPVRMAAPVVDLMAWWRPALAAAAVVAIASAVGLVRDRTPARPRTVAEALGFPAPITQWMESGNPAPWVSAMSSGGGR
jgi:hypothetical protein